MSKQIKLNCCLFSIALNQLITAVVFFHWLRLCFFRDCAVDAVEDFFADFAYLGLRGVDESAGRLVCEVRLVILKCYECFFVGCSVHSVVDSQFCRDGFVFFTDCLSRHELCFLVRFCDVFFDVFFLVFF